MKNLMIAFAVCLGIQGNCFAVECTLTVSEASTHSTESKVFYDQTDVNTITLKNFTATYFVDKENQIESLALTLPSGATSAPYYKLGSLPKMGILAKLENGDEASFICIR